MKNLKTTKKSAGKNTKEFLILHHTGGGSFESNSRILSGSTGGVSVHYVLGENGEIAKIGDHENILWHAGSGRFPDSAPIRNWNKISIGIEVVSDRNGGGFTAAQKKALPKLVREICAAEKIPPEKVLRHKDISGYRGKSDLADEFFAPETFEKWRGRIFGAEFSEIEQKNLDALLTHFSAAWWAFEKFPEIQNEIAAAKKRFENFSPKK
jgi:N-acetylmuramoyl-L-alanine amidase